MLAMPYMEYSIHIHNDCLWLLYIVVTVMKSDARELIVSVVDLAFISDSILIIQLETCK